MRLAKLADRLILSVDRSGVFSGSTVPDLTASFGGRVRAEAGARGGPAPWSMRGRLEGSHTTLKWLTGLFVAFMAWAALFHVDKVARGSGRIIPSTTNQIVQHLEGGIVDAILVQEGEHVRKGQVLLRISNQFTSADFQNAETEVTAKKIALARMEAIVSGARSFTVPEALAKQAPAIAASEEQYFYSQINQIGQQSGIAGGEIQAKRAEVASLTARLGNLRRQEELKMIQLDKLERAYRAEAISEREVLDKRAELLDLRTRIADVQNQIPQTLAELSTSTARHAEVRTQQIEETKDKAVQLRIELSKSEEALGAYHDKHAREEVRAPVAGFVNKLYAQTVGGVIKAGEPIAEIVPQEGTVTIEARISPRERGEIWPGLPATVRITAYDSAVFGGLQAKIVNISPDVLQDQSGASYYRVSLKANADSFGKDKPVLPGMTAEVSITSGKQTILEYLLGPLIKLRNSALRD